MTREPVSVGRARDTARARLTSKMGAWAAEVARVRSERPLNEDVGDAQAPAKTTTRVQASASTQAAIQTPAVAQHPDGEAVRKPAVRIALHPPSESQMLADQLKVERWVAQWARLDIEAWAQVDWATRSWRSVGQQQIPTRLRLEDPDDVAQFVGGEAQARWRILSARAEALGTAFVDAPLIGRAVQANATMLLELSDTDFERLLAVVRWVVENRTEGLRPRQLPIRGVDTKWFGDHRKLVADLAVAAGKTDLGIVDSDPLLRLRLLDPDLHPDGPHDFAAPLAEIAAMRVTPQVVFIVENRETVLAMPPWAGAAVIHGSGYAVGVLDQIPWVRNPRAKIVYWGDLDSDGLAILHSMRSHFPNAISVMMDRDTLLAFRDLWVTEPRPNRGEFPLLDTNEGEALATIRDEGGVRLEQERIPWEYALRQLKAALKEI